MKKITVFLCGVIVGGVIFSTVISYASTGKKTAELLYSNIKIVVNGNILKTELEPFSIDGRVYVPLRVVAEALNQKVGWENNTVLIGTGKQSLLLTDLIKPSVRLVDVGDYLTVNGDNIRGFYALGKQSQKSGSIDFFVQNKGIKEINGSILLDDNNPEGVEPAKIRVILDNKTIWQGSIGTSDNPIPINVKLDESSSHLVFELDNLNKTKVDFVNFTCKY